MDKKLIERFEAAQVKEMEALASLAELQVEGQRIANVISLQQVKFASVKEGKGDGLEITRIKTDVVSGSDIAMDEKGKFKVIPKKEDK